MKSRIDRWNTIKAFVSLMHPGMANRITKFKSARKRKTFEWKQ